MRLKSINDMHKLAASRGGKCLSNQYVSVNSKLKWQCNNGHVWEAVPNSIQQGKWCPYCSGSVKKTIEVMRELAASRGGKCLSTDYANTKTKLKWQCNNGHTWEAVPNSIQQGIWCPYCSGSVKKTIEEMQKLAASRGGICLSNEYVNSNTKLKWQCGKGHVWETRPSSIQQGAWCPYCSGLIKKTIEEMQKLAASRGGICLSDEYVNANTKLHWQCNKGHTWYATPADVIRKNAWCLICSGRDKKTIDDMHKLAASKGGFCLSKEYVSVMRKLKWQCNQGHVWESKPNGIQQGAWCPYCAGHDKKTIDDMRKLATEKHGKFISSKYINDQAHHEWECSEGHRWKTSPNRIKQGTWCPECSSLISERICRNIFEHLFNRKFPTLKPKWLINSTGGRMELDGYQEELGLAFEYHGIQHYKHNRWFHRSELEFNKRVEDDSLKENLCSQHGVVLIVIPYTIALSNLKEFIIAECSNRGIAIPDASECDNIEITSPYLNQKIKRMQELAEKKGGKCLSQHYTNAHTKLLWECANHHQFWSRPNSIITGTWCPICRGRGDINLNDLIAIAESRGGKLLSKEFKLKKDKYEWECSVGHRWQSTAKNVLRGTWCIKCRLSAALKRAK